jgi:hypothetical protein
MHAIEIRAPVMTIVLVALTVMASSCNSYPTEPSGDATEGAVAPAFSLPSAQGGSVSLADFRHKRDVLLYFSMGPG